MALLESLFPALVTGIAMGLVLWGGIRTELRWLRRDVDYAHARLDGVEDDLQDDRRTQRIPARVRRERRPARARR